MAWCVDGAKHGARTIPPGTFTGLQFMRTPAYIQWTGTLDITKLNYAADDSGGELDPHGADLVLLLDFSLTSSALTSPLAYSWETRSAVSSTAQASPRTIPLSRRYLNGISSSMAKFCEPEWASGDCLGRD